MTAEDSNLPADVAQEIAKQAIQRARRAMLGAYEEIAGELQSEDIAHAEAARRVVTDLYRLFSETEPKTVYEDVDKTLIMWNGVKIRCESFRTELVLPSDHAHILHVLNDRGMMEVAAESSAQGEGDVHTVTRPNSVVRIRS